MFLIYHIILFVIQVFVCFNLSYRYYCCLSKVISLFVNKFLYNVKYFSSKHEAQYPLHFSITRRFYLDAALYNSRSLLFCYAKVSFLHFWFSATNNRTRHSGDVLMSDHEKVRASRRLISGSPVSHEPFSWKQRALQSESPFITVHVPGIRVVCTMETIF